jgi:diguanylate cyclase (GGDEF)-like protein
LAEIKTGVHVDWSKLPDLIAVALLASAFASVAHRSHTRASLLWLIGWAMVAFHFAAFMFQGVAGVWGSLAGFLGIAALMWAAELFMWASVPYRIKRPNPWMFIIQLCTNTLYIGLVLIGPAASWALVPAAVLLGAAPIALSLLTLGTLHHPLRYVVVSHYAALSVFLLAFQHRQGNGSDLALNAVLFTAYFCCCFHFVYMFRRATCGAFVTIAGFFAWASVFVVAPTLAALQPDLHLESEVWNLPKYVVAVGMILLLLEDQIEHNKFLALHDELTGLPNRRLFHDRLASALERARRTGADTALLLIDLDQFKQVNDRMGHHVGDLLLQQVSSILMGRVRRSDTVARTGGDEFCLILEEPTSEEDARRVADSLIHLLKEPILLGKHKVRIGASIGLAVFPQDAADAEALCIAADLRMYAEKHGSARPEE